MSARAPHSALGRVALAPWLALACGGDVQEGMSSGPVTVGAANDATDATDATPPDPDSSGSQADTNDSSCGDGVVQEGDETDGEDMGDTSCPSLGFEDGIVTCSPSCRAITNACWTCGDAVLHSAETCDGELFRGESCQSQGFAGGTLKCAEDCRSL